LVQISKDTLRIKTKFNPPQVIMGDMGTLRGMNPSFKRNTHALFSSRRRMHVHQGDKMRITKMIATTGPS
jgi:hypothetical protein